MSETVNGKVDMGTRRLVTSHVENAASFYAYLESDQDFMAEIKKSVMAECKSVSKLNTPPKIDQVSFTQIGVISDLGRNSLNTFLFLSILYNKKYENQPLNILPCLIMNVFSLFT